jgi:hypothetical protein
VDREDDVSKVVHVVVEVAETTLGFEVIDVANVASVWSVFGALEVSWVRQALSPIIGQGPGLNASE